MSRTYFPGWSRALRPSRGWVRQNPVVKAPSGFAKWDDKVTQRQAEERLVKRVNDRLEQLTMEAFVGAREFRVGDIVDFAGLIGTLEGSQGSIKYPLRLRRNDHDYRFTINGLMFEDEPQGPRLKLLTPAPKRLVKKTLTLWANVYRDKASVHQTEQDARTNAAYNRIACIPVTGEYEVEE